MPITIIIKNDEGGTSENISPDNPLQNNENPDDKKASGKKSPERAMLINFFKNQAISWAKQGVQTYTKYTGQGLLQNKIDESLTITSDLMGIAVATATHPVLGLVTVGATVSKYVMTAYNKNIEIATSNREVSFISQGYGNIVISGGRYGA